MPKRMVIQRDLPERIYSIEKEPLMGTDGSMALSDEQYNQTKSLIHAIFC